MGMIILVIVTIIIFIVIMASLTKVSKDFEEMGNEGRSKPKSFIMSMPIAGINKNGCTEKHIGGFIGKLVPEPDNEFDPNAIKVVHQDGTHLGYIPAKETATVRMCLGEKFKKYPIVGAIKLVKDEDFEPLDEDDEPDDFFVGRIYIDSEKL